MSLTTDSGLPDGPPGNMSPAPSSFESGSGTGLRFSSRSIQIALGCLWLLDGGLQFQPAMFGRGFVYNLYYNDAMSQPSGLAHLLVSVVSAAEPHLLVWNTMFAMVQLTIGVGFLVRRTVRVAIVASVAWALFVWVFGEGLGGLFTGLANLVGGAPGAVLLYPLIGLIAWPVASAPGRNRPWQRAGGYLAGRAARGSWAVLWIGGAMLQLQPSYPYPAVLASTFSMNLMGPEPAPLVSLDTFLTRTAIQLGDPLVLGLALLEAAIGLAVLRRFHTRLFLGVGIGLSILFWIGGQNFGGMLTGEGTDPGSAPLFVLLALTLFPMARSATGPVRPEMSIADETT
jgi:hypothetical protein